MEAKDRIVGCHAGRHNVPAFEMYNDVECVGCFEHAERQMRMEELWAWEERAQMAEFNAVSNFMRF